MVRSTQTDRPVNVAAHLEMQSDFFFFQFFVSLNIKQKKSQMLNYLFVMKVQPIYGKFLQGINVRTCSTNFQRAELNVVVLFLLTKQRKKRV